MRRRTAVSRTISRVAAQVADRRDGGRQQVDLGLCAAQRAVDAHLVGDGDHVDRLAVAVQRHHRREDRARASRGRSPRASARPRRARGAAGRRRAASRRAPSCSASRSCGGATGAGAAATAVSAVMRLSGDRGRARRRGPRGGARPGRVGRAAIVLLFALPVSWMAVVSLPVFSGVAPWVDNAQRPRPDDRGGHERHPMGARRHLARHLDGAPAPDRRLADDPTRGHRLTARPARFVGS